MPQHHHDADRAEQALRRRRATLIVLAPAWLMLCERSWADAPENAILAIVGGATLATLLQLVAGLLWTDNDSKARSVAVAALLVGTGVSGIGLHERPLAVLFLGLGSLLLGAWWLWRPIASGALREDDHSGASNISANEIELRWSVAAMAAVWLLHAWIGRGGGATAWATIAMSLLLGLALGAPAVRELVAGRPLRAFSVAAAWSFGALGALQFHQNLFALSTWLMVGPLATAAWTFGDRRGILARASGTSALDDLLSEPARLMLVTFAGGGMLGGLLLSLPAASTGEPIAPVDAFFTAFSAICVTGLGVRDTGVDFSGLGQLVIFALIQVGGLGILTFSTGAMLLVRSRLSLRHEGAMVELIGAEHRGVAVDALRRVLRLTFAIEAVSAVLLTLLFWIHGDDLIRAAWRGLFTAVSAYCNAGFALQGDSLVPYATNPWIMHVAALTIIAGGLGPQVLTSLPKVRGWRATPTVPLVLVSSALLIAIQTVLLAVLEWDHSLAHLAPLDRLHNAYFQAVSPRTAGFNSIDLATVQPASWSLIIVLMFIGGSPASTAGGIKTTTAAVLVLSMIAALRGRSEADAFGFRLSHTSVYRAGAVASAGLASVAALLFALQVTQQMTVEQAVFESVSALGTVGLSVGGTAALDEVGKVLIMMAMFAGRVGPLSLFLLLVSTPSGGGWQRPEADVAVG